MSHIIAQDAALDVQKVGGKAVALAKLAGLGFNPPRFFVIHTDAFEQTHPAAGLEDAIASLGKGPFAVRSSARQEDGAEHSHAGQFETVLNVPAKDIWDAAQKYGNRGSRIRLPLTARSNPAVPKKGQPLLCKT